MDVQDWMAKKLSLMKNYAHHRETVQDPKSIAAMATYEGEEVTAQVIESEEDAYAIDGMASKATDEIQHQDVAQGNEMDKEGDATATLDKQALDCEHSDEEKLKDTEDIIFERTGKKIVFSYKKKMLIVIVIMWFMQKAMRMMIQKHLKWQSVLEN